MSSFEYVMVLVSIIIALAIAHLLTAIAASVHRLRGHGEPIEMDAVYNLWVAYVLIYLISFWWWEFKLQEIMLEWSFGVYLFIVVYSIILFMLAAILVPHRMQGVTHSYDYFMHGRKWFFSVFLLATAVDIADTFLKGYSWGVRPAVLVTYAVVTAAAVTGMVSKRRSVQLSAASVAFAAQLIYIFQELGVLGSW